MPILPLSLSGVKPQDKPFTLSDGDGLQLLVQPNGSKLWRFRYQFAGVENMMALGSFPATSLADARRSRNEARKLLEAGTDPSVKKKLDRLAAESAARNTFKLVAEEHVANLAANGAASVTVDKHRWLLLDVASSIAQRPIADITSAELLDLLKRVEKTGRRETAKRLRATMSTVFRLAIVTLRATNDPTVALKGALLRPNVQRRAAITDEKDFGTLLRALDEFKGWPTISAAMMRVWRLPLLVRIFPRREGAQLVGRDCRDRLRPAPTRRQFQCSQATPLGQTAPSHDVPAP